MILLNKNKKQIMITKKKMIMKKKKKQVNVFKQKIILQINYYL